jgi:hypothetical protein
MIEQDRKEWIVITSDRQIMDHAWKNSSVPIPSDQFMGLLEQSIHRNLSQPHNSLPNAPTVGSPLFANEGVPVRAGALSEDEEGDSLQQHKGSPRQLSKKEKALIRVLNKL